MTQEPPTPAADDARRAQIVAVLVEAFSDLMASDADAFRTKFRKMAADPFAFYRGSACLFYADLADAEDRWSDEQTSRTWIHGDLHAANFGSYMDGAGRIVFDVNDFDEAYLGSYTWDLRRFAASLSLMGWQKALPADAVDDLVAVYLDAYLDQVEEYRHSDVDDFALHLDNTEGPIRAALVVARRNRRVDLLDANTVEVDGVRRIADHPTVRRLDEAEHARISEAFGRYLETIPAARRHRRTVYYDLRDVAGKSGFGIGSAGLPAYSVLVEGYSQALDNDVLLSMKQANVPAISRFVDPASVDGHFRHEGHRTVVSQRALQVHTDPMLGFTEVDGVGYVVSEVSPYEVDLDWSGLIEPDDIRAVVAQLGRATAKIHCASDEDSEHDLVDFQVEDAITEAIGGRRDELVAWVTDFGNDYARQVRRDHELFVEAFRGGRTGVSAV